MKHLLSFVGKLLLLLAFIVTAAEVAAHARGADLSWVPSTADIWGFYAPQSAAQFAAAHPGGVLHYLMLLPAWALFGLPGFALVILFHSQLEDLEPELEESMFLYDKLVKRIHEEGFDDLSNLDLEDTNLAEHHHAEQNSKVDPLQTADLHDDNLHDDREPKRDFLLGNPKRPA